MHSSSNSVGFVRPSTSLASPLYPSSPRPPSPHPPSPQPPLSPPLSPNLSDLEVGFHLYPARSPSPPPSQLEPQGSSSRASSFNYIPYDLPASQPHLVPSSQSLPQDFSPPHSPSMSPLNPPQQRTFSAIPSQTDLFEDDYVYIPVEAIPFPWVDNKQKSYRTSFPRFIFFL